MNHMTDFMNREMIKEKIDEVAEKFFDMEITDPGLHKEVEDDMSNMLNSLSTELAKHGELEDVWPMAIAYFMDTTMAQLIVIKLQNKFIESVKKGEDDDPDNG